MEQQPESQNKVMLVKRGGEVPGNAVLMSDQDVLQYQLNRIQKFQPQREMTVFNYSTYIIGATVGLSSLVIVSTMRKNFNLGGLSKGLTYGPSLLVPASCAGVAHDLIIKHRILLGQEPCATCVTLRSGVIQTLAGVCYPLLISFLTCIPVARKNYTLPLPQSAVGLGYFKLVKQVSPKSLVLLQLILGNLLVGSYFAYKESDLFLHYFSS
ncbi:hypothetical protein Btru_044463 [Bulinus truncatus]|nr:hypothetical protein Btru_044463 [Bulinus truncatus]